MTTPEAKPLTGADLDRLQDDLADCNNHDNDHERIALWTLHNAMRLLASHRLRDAEVARLAGEVEGLRKAQKGDWKDAADQWTDVINAAHPCEGVETLACPLCGCKASPLAGSRCHWVRCDMCHCEGPLAKTAASAIEAWNRRAPQPVAGPIEGDEYVSTDALLLAALRHRGARGPVDPTAVYTTLDIRWLRAAADRIEALAIPTNQARGLADVTGAAVYVASRASILARGEMWRGFRECGYPINSTWIDEDGPKASRDLSGLWQRIVNEVTSARGVILYVEPDDFPLKGAFIEVGIALAAGVPIIIVAPGVEIEERNCRPLGSWVKHPLVMFANTVAGAFETFGVRQTLSAPAGEKA